MSKSTLGLHSWPINSALILCTKVRIFSNPCKQNGVFNTRVSPVFSGLKRGYCKSIASGGRGNASIDRGNAFTTQK